MKVNLDINQRNAVYIKEKNVLVVASPGSGKTTVIINRVNHLIEDLKINEGNIIVITFTRTAADNMRNRYKNIFKKERAPFFGTFHGLFYKILLREGYDIKIMDGGKGHAIIKNVLSRYFDDVNDDKVREVMNNISMFKTSLCTVDEFKSTVSKDIFLECLKVYESNKESFDEEVEQEDAAGLPKMEVGEVLQREEIAAVQRFSQAPARYTEASLVRKLEELGIGRPSTYAPTISTIQQRGYVEKGNKEGVKREYSLLKLTGKEIKETVQTEMSGSEKSKLIPTDVGCVVNDFLMQYFPKIMDYNFTASVEKEFDEVAEGEKKWTDLMEVFYENFHPLVETTLATKTEHKVGERMLGTDPKSGKPVSVKIGRFGPVVQIGSSDDEEKPRFAQLNKEHSLETITLEEALDLFKLPRVLGELDGTTVSVGVGRFGPYVRHGNEYVSIPKEMDPMAVTFEEAVRMLSEKKEKEAQKIIKQFPENPDMQILNGRYGPYIAYQKKNYKIPENVNPADLNLDACFKVIELQAQKAEMRKAKGAKAKTKK